MPRLEAPVLAQPENWFPEIPLQPYNADVLLDGGETLELAGISFETLNVPGHSPGHVAYYADGALFSGDVLFAGSVGRTDIPHADWARSSSRSAAWSSASRPRPSSIPATAPRRPSVQSSSATRSWTSSACREVRGAERHTGRLARAAAALGARDPRDRGRLRDVRLPADHDAALRGHRALHAHLGRRAPTSSRRRCTRSPTAATAR